MASFISGIQAAMRPIAKELIKAGLSAMDSVSEFVAEASEQIKDLVAEAKAELSSDDKEKAGADKDDTRQNTQPPADNSKIA